MSGNWAMSKSDYFGLCSLIDDLESMVSEMQPFFNKKDYLIDLTQRVYELENPSPMPKIQRPITPPPPPVEAPPVDIISEGEYPVNEQKPEVFGHIVLRPEDTELINALKVNREIMTKINLINQTLKGVTAIDSDDMSMTAVKKIIQNLLDNYGILSDA